MSEGTEDGANGGERKFVFEFMEAGVPGGDVGAGNGKDDVDDGDREYAIAQRRVESRAPSCKCHAAHPDFVAGSLLATRVRLVSRRTRREDMRPGDWALDMGGPSYPDPGAMVENEPHEWAGQWLTPLIMDLEHVTARICCPMCGRTHAIETHNLGYTNSADQGDMATSYECRCRFCWLRPSRTPGGVPGAPNSTLSRPSTAEPITCAYRNAADNPCPAVYLLVDGHVVIVDGRVRLMEASRDSILSDISRVKEEEKARRLVMDGGNGIGNGGGGNHRGGGAA